MRRYLLWLILPFSLVGHSLLPVPRKVALAGESFRLSPGWRLELAGVNANDAAVEVLREELAARFHLRLGESGPGPAIRLAIAPGAVEVGQALDRNRQALADQAYRIELSPETVRITGNTATGVFYGVATLVQLLEPKAELPRGEIVDWPDLQYRAIYWDDAHHLDRMDYLKRALRTRHC